MQSFLWCYSCWVYTSARDEGLWRCKEELFDLCLKCAEPDLSLNCVKVGTDLYFAVKVISEQKYSLFAAIAY